MDDFYSTRQHNLLIYNLDFVFSKVLLVLKENFNNIAAKRMVKDLWKQAECNSVYDASKVFDQNISILTIRMEKHINILPNDLICKHWQNYAKTWLNQPARKPRRCTTQLVNTNKMVYLTLDKILRDIIHGRSVKYNMKVRLGKGSSELELKNL